MEWEALSELMSYDALRQLWLARGIKDECLLCDANDWVGLGPLPKPDPLILAKLQTCGEVNPSEGFMVYAIACRNCGFVRLHAPDAIDYLVDDR